MKTILAIGAVAALTVSAQADIFSDNFDTENGGVGELDFSPLTNWTVSNGTVDLIGNGFWDLGVGAGHGLFIDLDGSTGDAGTMVSINLALNPGSYTLYYDLAGSQRGGDETAAVNFGGSLASHTLPSADGWTTFSLVLNVAVAGNYTISFEGQGGDNVGLLLDNIRVVPTPGAAALMGVGILASARRRRA